MPENIRQLDDVLVCAIKCRREQVAQIVRENFPCVDARADAQLFHFRPNLISRHGLAAFGAKDRAGGGFFCVANLSSLRQSFDGSRIVRILPLSAISVLPFFAASTVMYCTSLTRMPVEQMLSIRSARARSPVASAAATNLSYSLRVSSCLLSRTGGADCAETLSPHPHPRRHTAFSSSTKFDILTLLCRFWCERSRRRRFFAARQT